MMVFSKPVSNYYKCYNNEYDADEFLFIWNFGDAGGSSAVILLKTFIRFYGLPIVRMLTI